MYAHVDNARQHVECSAVAVEGNASGFLDEFDETPSDVRTLRFEVADVVVGDENDAAVQVADRVVVEATEVIQAHCSLQRQQVVTQFR